MTPRLPAWTLLALLAAGPALHAVDRSRSGPGGKDDFLTGTWNGERPALSARGLDFGFTYTTAVFANVAGGRERGAVLEGTGDFAADCDLAKLVGWTDARIHVSSILAHGPSISAKYVGDTNIISDFDLPDSLYLHEVWFEQSWLGQKLSLRLGKLSADLEFPINSYADAIPLPLYPTGALGARLHFAPTAALFFDAAIYDGNPNEPGRTANRHGLHVHLARSEGATLFASVGLSLGAAKDATFPAGTWKLGAYHSTRDYPDVLTGAPLRGDHALFLNGDQTLWRENPAKKDDDQGLALYVVAEVVPPDRNTYHYGFGGGPYYTGLFPGRDHDVLYVNFLYTRFSDRFARASVAAGGPHPVFENALQAYYQIAVKKFWAVQPQVDYVVHTGGTGQIPNATVLSLRTTVTF